MNDNKELQAVAAEMVGELYGIADGNGGITRLIADMMNDFLYFFAGTSDSGSDCQGTLCTINTLYLFAKKLDAIALHGGNNHSGNSLKKDNMSVKERLAENLRIIRQSLRISQFDICKCIDVSQPMYADKERNFDFTAKEIGDICEYLKISLDYLLKSPNV